MKDNYLRSSSYKVTLMDLDDIWEEEEPTIESIIKERLTEREAEGLVEEIDPFKVRVREKTEQHVTVIIHLDVKRKRIRFTATFQHDPTLLERSIQFIAGHHIEPQFTNEDFQKILEDVYLQVKHLILPEVLGKESGDPFEIETIGENFTNFHLDLYYEDKPTEELNKKFDELLQTTFLRLIRTNNRVGEFLAYAVGLYEVRAPIELKLLELRQKIFQAQFYFETSKGRFAETQSPKYLRYKEEAQKMYEDFRKEYPKVETSLIDQLFRLI